jgi:hypothetical protein
MKDLLKTEAQKDEAIEKANQAIRDKVSASLDIGHAFTVAKPDSKPTAYMVMAGAGNTGSGSKVTLGAFSQAVMVVSNACGMTEAGTIQAAKKPFNRELFDALYNDHGKVYAYHKKLGNIDDKGLTKDGRLFFGNRIKGKASAFNTQLEAVKALIVLMKKGGKRSKFRASDESPSFAVNFSYKVSGEFTK